MVHVGQNNFVLVDCIVAVSTLRSATVRRAVDDAKKAGLLLDFTGPLETKGIVFTNTGVVLRVALRPMDIARIINELDSDA